MVGILAVLLLIGVAAVAWSRTSRGSASASPSPTPQKKRINDPVNIIPVSDRPYLQIVPDATGKHVFLQVKELKKTALSLDYELEYQSGELLQGAFGAIDITKLPASKDILLGSCSAGGACTYHVDVKGGTLLARFSGGESYAVKSEWKYIENKARESQLSSKDAKFQMTAPELSKLKYVVVYNSPGYPGKPEGEVISDIYSLAMPTSLPGQAKLTIRTTQEASTATILGWDGQSWKEFKSVVDGKSVTATVDFLEAYLVVKK